MLGRVAQTVTVCGAGGTWCPTVTDEPQPCFLAVTTSIPCMNKAPGKKDNLELSHLRTEASVPPACSWHPVPASGPSAACGASVPGAQRKGTGPSRPRGPLPTPTGSSFLPSPGPTGQCQSQQHVIPRQMTAKSAPHMS